MGGRSGPLNEGIVNRFRFIAISILLLLFLMAKCGYNPFAHRYTTEEPNFSDVTGTYVLDRQTVDHDVDQFSDSASGEKVIPTIHLNGDGSYHVEHLPKFEYKGSRHRYDGYSLITREGEWDKKEIGSIDNGYKLERYWGVKLNGLPDNFDVNLSRAALMGQAPPYGLCFTHSDPDWGKALLFRRKGAE